MISTPAHSVRSDCSVCRQKLFYLNDSSFSPQFDSAAKTLTRKMFLKKTKVTVAFAMHLETHGKSFHPASGADFYFYFFQRLYSLNLERSLLFCLLRPEKNHTRISKWGFRDNDRHFAQEWNLPLSHYKFK